MTASDTQRAQVAYVTDHVRQIDPAVTDEAIARYLAEIEVMAAALDSMDHATAGHLEPFSPQWRGEVVE